MKSGISRIGITALIAAALSLLVIVSYIASGGFSNRPSENSLTTIRAEADKSSYTPGEVIQAKVYFINNGRVVFTTRALSVGYEVLDSKGEIVFGKFIADYDFAAERPFTVPAENETMLADIYTWPQLIQTSGSVEQATPGTYILKITVYGPINVTAETSVVIR